MKLNELPKSITRNKKRLGRGYGSGKGGHTSSRGAKGDNARGKVALLFEGTKMKKSFLKRLPLFRGKGKNKSQNQKPLIINLDHLNLLGKDVKVVDLASLIKANVVDERKVRAAGVKILGNGEVKRALKVVLPCSKSALKKIEKAGGEVVIKSKKVIGEKTVEKPVVEEKAVEKKVEDKKENKVITPKKSTSKTVKPELSKNKKKLKKV